MYKWTFLAALGILATGCAPEDYGRSSSSTSGTRSGVAASATVEPEAQTASAKIGPSAPAEQHADATVSTKDQPADNPSWRADVTAKGVNDNNAMTAGGHVEGQAETNVPGAGSRSMKGWIDQQYVNAIASSGLFETMSTDLADQKDKNSNDAVKQYASQLHDDHTKANDELRKLAQRKGWNVPNKMQPDEQALYDRLVPLTGADFNREFLRAQRQAHQNAIALFESASQNAKDPELRAWAAEKLPALRDHLKMNPEMPMEQR